MRSKVWAPAQYAGLWAALAGLTWGLMSAAWLSHPGEYFWDNVAGLLAPHAIVLVALLIFRAPFPVTGGTAMAMALYLSLFGLWFTTRGHGATGWLLYMFSFPGALIGAGMAWFFTAKAAPLKAVWWAMLWAASGLAANQAIVFLYLWM